MQTHQAIKLHIETHPFTIFTAPKQPRPSKQVQALAPMSWKSWVPQMLLLYYLSQGLQDVPASTWFVLCNTLSWRQ
jgi:hypothetical protein